VTAGVVGLISATSLGLLGTALRDVPTVLIFATALLVLYRWKSKMVVPAVVIAGGLIGLIVLGVR
jgi:chromate transporter